MANPLLRHGGPALVANVYLEGTYSEIAVAVVGDGEAETGPLEGSWKGIKFLNAARDGAVLPILRLNGYKILGHPQLFTENAHGDPPAPPAHSRRTT